MFSMQDIHLKSDKAWLVSSKYSHLTKACWADDWPGVGEERKNQLATGQLG